MTEEDLASVDLAAYWERAGELGGAPSPLAKVAPEVFDDALPVHLFAQASQAARWDLSRRVSSGKGRHSTVAAPMARASMNAGFKRRQSRMRRLLKSSELPEVGAIIDKYRIEELVGTGGFSVVYRATHLMLQMSVAIKLLQPEMLRRQPELPALLTKEARYAARINHQHVVRVYDATHTSRITYVVMEYIDGGSLADLISLRGAVPVEQLLEIARQITLGLKAGLDEGIIHRDIKPSNVLRAKGGAWKIVDLGLAQPNYDPDGPPIPGAAKIVGTPGYMAPEQMIDSTTVDFRADLYALGVTLYEAATAEPPYPIDDAMRCLELHRSQPVPSPLTLAPHLPAELAALIQQMMAKSPRERPPSYDSVLERLRGIEASLPG